MIIINKSMLQWLFISDIHYYSIYISFTNNIIIKCLKRIKIYYPSGGLLYRSLKDVTYSNQHKKYTKFNCTYIHNTQENRVNFCILCTRKLNVKTHISRHITTHIQPPWNQITPHERIQTSGVPSFVTLHAKWFKKESQ